MKHSEKMKKMGRLLAEWNHISAHAQSDRSDRQAGRVCYEITKLFPRIFIREWNRLLAEGQKKATE